MKTTPLLNTFLVFFALGLIDTAGARAARPPNIILFVADDHGQDAGCYGNKIIQTPNLDRLASEGTRYTRAFCTTASCSASRSVILSGLHNHANGQYGHQHSFHHFYTFNSVKSLPVILAEHGYRTGRIGKFHMQPEEVYKFQSILGGNPGGARNPVSMAEKCVEFIRDTNAPFFLYFCTADPHRSGDRRKDNPQQPDAFGNGRRYDGVEDISYNPKDVLVPPWLPDTPECRAELAEYYQSVSRVDQGLGRLIEALKQTGQYDRTIILYTSDNGAAFPGSKTTLYEPGMRLPLIVRSPFAKWRGVTCGAMVSWVDLTPTILDFAGVKEVLAPPLVAGNPEVQTIRKQPVAPYPFQGRSFAATIEQEKPAGWNEVFASHTFHEITMYYPMRVIRTERYKLILNLAHPLPFPFASDLYDSTTWQTALKSGQGVYGKRRIEDFIHRPRYELYDLQADPDEIRNLAGQAEHQAAFKELSEKLKEFQKRTRDPWIVKYEYE